MVSIMFIRLLKLSDEVRRKPDVSSLEFVVHASAPCPAPVKQTMIDWRGPVTHEYCGSTETSPVTFCTADDWLAHRGTVGRALPGVEVMVIDATGWPPSAVRDR